MTEYLDTNLNFLPNAKASPRPTLVPALPLEALSKTCWTTANLSSQAFTMSGDLGSYSTHV